MLLVMTRKPLGRKTTLVIALDVFKQLVNLIETADLINLVGLGVLAAWLIRTSLGRRSLVRSRPRRNSMTPLTPFIPFAVWLLGAYLLFSLVTAVSGPLGDEGKAVASNLVFCAGAILTIGLILPLARVHFARGLKGFGLNPRTIPRDIGAAVATLLAVWPLVFAAIVLTTAVGRAVKGRDFNIPRHEELEVMAEFPTVWVRLLVVAMAVVVAPLLEEMLFRGLLQTVVRTYVGTPWPAIAIASVLFAVVHADAEHWPALFVLAMGLGYAYEKSGSLFRPIFMHALFNGMVLAAALLG